MNVYQKNKDKLVFDDNYYMDWVKFERGNAGSIYIDRSGAPRLTEANVKMLVEWLSKDQRKTK